MANLWPEGLYSTVTGSNSNVIKYAAQTVKIMVTTKQNLARNDTFGSNIKPDTSTQWHFPEGYQQITPNP